MISKICVKRIAASFVVAAAVAICAPAPFAAAQSGGAKTLDYEYFKTKVEPIFLKHRSENHARCYACHEITKHPNGLSLQSLPPGATIWTEEQSRMNFQTVSKLVVPGNLDASLFPHHPLAPEAGGDTRVHNGGRQFESQSDPDFQTILAWIKGEKAPAR